MSIVVLGRFRVLPGKRDAFEEVAFALAARAVDEPGTLAYRWFQDSGVTGNYVVIEEYVDDDAAMTHNDNAADLLARVADCAELTAIEIHGPAGPRILTWADGNPLVTLHPELSG
jgi:quinol monooxygenase YgiN